MLRRIKNIQNIIPKFKVQQLAIWNKRMKSTQCYQNGLRVLKILINTPTIDYLTRLYNIYYFKILIQCLLLYKYLMTYWDTTEVCCIRSRKTAASLSFIVPSLMCLILTSHKYGLLAEISSDFL